jgi:hypothetical protein
MVISLRLTPMADMGQEQTPDLLEETRRLNRHVGAPFAGRLGLLAMVVRLYVAR